jgi:hypothetical protein
VSHFALIFRTYKRQEERVIPIRLGDDVSARRFNLQSAAPERQQNMKKIGTIRKRRCPRASLALLSAAILATIIIVLGATGCMIAPKSQAQPLANAGSNQTVATGATVQLDGSKSSDPSGLTLTFAWSLLTIPAGSKATLSSTNAVTPTFVADVGGNYIAQLTVSSGTLTANSQVTITANVPPVASAGSNQTVATGATVKLDGSKSSDPDGDKLTFLWSLLTVPAGSKAVLSGMSSVSPTFVADVGGSFVIQLTVSDGISSSSAKVTAMAITTNLPPVANAGANQTVTTGSTVKLDGSRSNDPDGDTLTFSWKLVANPPKSSATLSDSTIASPAFIADQPGAYTAQLTVSDGTLTANSQVSITANTPPVADAGSNQTVATGATVQLDGSKSNDPDGDNLTYSWSLVNAPAGTKATLSSTTTVNPSFVADQAGTYVAELTVNDGFFSNTAKISITAGSGGQSASLAAGPPTFWSSSNSLFVIFPVVNNGTGTASNVQITSISLTSQGGVVASVTAPASFPLLLGDINSGLLAAADFTFDGTNLIAGNQYLLTASSTYQASGSTVNLSVSANVTYGTTSIFDLPASPLNLTPSVDSTKAVSGTVSADTGGTIIATGADGTIFTLTVPANALLSDEVVTMTPVSSAAGMPLSGGLVAGVQLAPEGLRLFQPAKLTIQPPTNVPIAQQVGFSYHGTGQEFFLYPLDVVNAVSFTILHFSGYGLGLGNAPSSTPTDAEDRLTSEIQQELLEARQAQLLGQPDPEGPSELGGFMEQYFTEVIEPALATAETNLDTADQAISKAVGWNRNLQLLGAGEEDEQPYKDDWNQIVQHIDSITVKKYDRAFQRCVTQADVTQLTAMLAIIRTQELVGGDPSALLGPNYQQELDACANLKLVFNFDDDVAQVFSGGPGGIGGLGFTSGESHVQADGLQLTWKRPVNPTPGGFQGDFEISGAPLNYLSLNYVNGTVTEPGGIVIQFCTTLVSDSAGNTITVRAQPDYNITAGPPSVTVTLTVSSGEVFQVGDMVLAPPPGTPCIMAPPLTLPFYQTGFIVAGGRNLFFMPLNTTQTFSFVGTYVAPIIDTATETRTIMISVVTP